MNAEPLSVDLALLVIRDVARWLAAIVVTLCGLGLVLYASLVVGYCFEPRRRAGTAHGARR